MAISLTEYISIRRLVAVSNDEIWWEDNVATGSMTELDTSAYPIDTTDQLNIFEAYQKAFVVNGAKLGVADFINTKLSTADIRPNDSTNIAPLHGTVLTGGTSGATMIVDYCNAVNGAALVYGFTTSGTFDEAGEVITGTNISGDPTAVSFTLDALPVAPPHWYPWTVYNNDEATYGVMPNKAYLGCLYNGRTVLSGNPESPNNWYMSRQTNPWDFNTNATDDQAAVAGHSSDLGELGDIVRSLSPYKDDYLSFGCANSMWTLFGDPRRGGAVRELSLTTGNFGANSYCWDNENNFYFWGNNGLYRTQIPGNPQCISQFKLPRLVKTEAASPLTHRITLVYDRDRHGILVAITALATGVNSNYWYDLNALDEQEIGAFFPESYPATCGVYSGVYYDSNTPSLKGMLLGNTDGYIRVFDDTVKDDVVGEQLNAINSFVCLGPMPMSAIPQRNGTLSGIDLTVAGVQPSGDADDSNDVDFKVYTARTASKTMALATANTGPNIAGTFAGPGNVRGTTKRQSVRAENVVFRLQNTAESESWAFENMYAYLSDSGRKK